MEENSPVYLAIYPTIEEVVNSTLFRYIQKLYPTHEIAVSVWHDLIDYHGPSHNIVFGSEIDQHRTKPTSSMTIHYRDEDPDGIDKDLIIISTFNENYMDDKFAEVAHNLDCYCGMLGVQYRAKEDSTKKSYLCFMNSEEKIDITKEVPKVHAKKECIFHISDFRMNTDYYVCSSREVPNSIWEHYATYRD